MSSSDYSTKIVHGLKWGYLSSIFNGVGQLVFTVIMSRILAPSDYGIMSIALFIILFGRYFSQFGLTQALIQKEDLTEEDIRSGFTISLIFGTVIFLIIALTSRSISIFFSEARLQQVLPVLALSFVFNSLSITSLGLLRRRLEYKKLAFLEVVSQLSSYFLIGLPLALMGFGFWSLILANISLSFFQMIIGYRIVKHSLKLNTQFRKHKNLLWYGGRISFISILEYFNSNLPVIIIGRYMTTSLVGYYNRSNVLGSMIFQNFNQTISRTLFPVFSRLGSDPKELSSMFLKSINRVFFILFPLSIGLILSSEELIGVVLGNQWKVVAIIFPAHIIAFLIAYVNHYFGVMFESKAILRSKITSNLILLLVFAVGVGLMGVKIELIEVVELYAFAQLLRLLWSLKVCHYNARIKIGAVFKNLIPGFLNGGILLAALFAKKIFIPFETSIIFDLVLNILLGVIVLIFGFYIPLNKGFKAEIMNRIRRVN